MPKFREISVLGRAVNRLLGVTATFDTFDTNPSNPGRMTDGDFTTETGEGVKSLAGVNGIVGQIYFDMGASYPVLILAHVDIHRDSGDGWLDLWIYRSMDGIAWQECGMRAIYDEVSDFYYGMIPFFTYARYIRLTFRTGSVTVNPSVFHVKVGEVIALQLL